MNFEYVPISNIHIVCVEFNLNIARKQSAPIRQVITYTSNESEYYMRVCLCLWVSCSFENWWLKTCLMLTFSAYFDIPQTNNILQSVRLAASRNVCKVLCPYWPLCACLQRLRECVCVYFWPICTQSPYTNIIHTNQVKVVIQLSKHNHFSFAQNVMT